MLNEYKYIFTTKNTKRNTHKGHKEYKYSIAKSAMNRNGRKEYDGQNGIIDDV
jgi:hypothetical protein